ncbi:MAG: methylenetetrahydrofolate reductase [NAD(P)H] [Bdellovibrio sp. CG10_big_fil_rev_8_21_14_0_10_47_8]|nr:MAG: methylenetetrahydrofolate reductase [NAD(P)H] [Bdellovibrio sp. CG10_big_fil_rev_8_21_14_0_10_47_8]
MKVIEHLEKSRNPLFSYEIVPPPRGRSVKDLIDVVEMLSPYEPPWIDVTAHSSVAFYNELADGSIQRKIMKKRPGTIGICGIIQNRFRIDTVVHLLCQGFTREETEDALIELGYLGIENVLALCGDYLNFQKPIAKDRTSNKYAKDLVTQVTDLRRGQYLEEMSATAALDFCVGVAGYPEKHFEAPNLKTDIEYMKQKVEAGADYIVTQMFFDNSKYLSFLKQCRDAGITVPIIPGLKVLRSVQQLKSIPKNFYVDIPEPLSDEILKNPTHAAEIGKRWALDQVEELFANKVPCAHFYVMNDASLVVDIVKKFK